MTHAHVATTAAPTYAPSSDRDLIDKVPPKEWSRLQLLGFRFLVIYFLLYSFPGPIGEVPYLDIVQKPFDALWRVVVRWMGAHVLRLTQPISLQPSGSGDKLFDWVQVFTMLGLAMLAAIVWTLVDRKPHRRQQMEAARGGELRRARQARQRFNGALPNPHGLEHPRDDVHSVP